MDRFLKAPDKVHVYASHTDPLFFKPPLRVVQLVPYSSCGYDNYRLDGVMYPGFVDEATRTEVRVFLDRPLFPTPTGDRT